MWPAKSYTAHAGAAAAGEILYGKGAAAGEASCMGLGTQPQQRLQRGGKRTRRARRARAAAAAACTADATLVEVLQADSWGNSPVVACGKVLKELHEWFGDVPGLFDDGATFDGQRRLMKVMLGELKAKTCEVCVEPLKLPTAVDVEAAGTTTARAIHKALGQLQQRSMQHSKVQANFTAAVAASRAARKRQVELEVAHALMLRQLGMQEHFVP